jgi:hypothetical protein
MEATYSVVQGSFVVEEGFLCFWWKWHAWELSDQSARRLVLTGYAPRQSDVRIRNIVDYQLGLMSCSAVFLHGQLDGSQQLLDP